MLRRTRLCIFLLISTELYCSARDSGKLNDEALVALIKEMHEKEGIFSYDRSITQSGYLTRQSDSPNIQTNDAKKTAAEHPAQSAKKN